MESYMKSYTPVKRQRFSRSPARKGTSRRRGVVAVYVALCMLVIMGAAAISFDLSFLYNRKSEAQKAADASALAGAVGGQNAARQYAADNGYDITKGATVIAGPDATTPGLYRVTLSRPEPLYFAKYFLKTNANGTTNVGATAAAITVAGFDIPMQNYGIGAGAVNLAVFGRDAFRYNGDRYSSAFIEGPNGSKIANPEFNPNGYDFGVTLPADKAKYRTDFGSNFFRVQLFDPGTSNAGGGNTPSAGKAIDEIRNGWGGTIQTQTTYTLSYQNARGEDVVIASKQYGADDATTDMKWDNPFEIDLTDSRYSQLTNLKLNVKTTAGTSENGFQLRAGPPTDPAITDAEWVSKYGNVSQITAKGSIPINFNTNTTLTLNLGHVPPLADGGNVAISKFDLDVGSSSLTYTDKRDDGTIVNYDGRDKDHPAGTLSPNDTYTTDKYLLPKNYPGGTWTATYVAGLGDTSVWTMTYPGPGDLRLVR